MACCCINQRPLSSFGLNAKFEHEQIGAPFGNRFGKAHSLPIPHELEKAVVDSGYLANQVESFGLQRQVYVAISFTIGR